MPVIRMSLIHDLAADVGRDLDVSELGWMLDDDVHSARGATTIVAEHGRHYGAGQPYYVPGVLTLDAPAHPAQTVTVAMLGHLMDRAARRAL